MATSEPPKCNGIYSYENAKKLDAICQTFPTTQTNPPVWQRVINTNNFFHFNQ